MRKKLHIKTLMRFSQKLSRKQNIGLLLLLSAVIGLLGYISIGSPAFSAQRQYRRAEKANMVGPATLLDILVLEDYLYDRIAIAEENDAVILYVWQAEPLEITPVVSHFVYRRKQGDVAVYAAPSDRFTFWDNLYSVSLPVLVFDDTPAAVRAELDLTIPYPERANPYTNQQYRKYSLQSQREKDGYFLFMIHEEGNQQLKHKGLALQLLSSLSNCQFTTYTAGWEDTVSAAVRLYDREDKLLCEETVIIEPTTRELRK